MTASMRLLRLLPGLIVLLSFAGAAPVLPRVQPAAAASPPTTGPVIVPVAATAAAGPVALTELRFRSYPSFTRIVLETSSALTTRVETSVGKEARVRLIGLAAEARTEEIGD